MTLRRNSADSKPNTSKSKTTGGKWSRKYTPLDI